MKTFLYCTFFFLLVASHSLPAQPAIQWDKAIGGNGGDFFQSVNPTSDGGYILGGSSDSEAGEDKTEGSLGLSDYWIVKIAANGTKQWDRRYGGDHYDVLQEVRQTADGGYILGGYSYTGANGDKSEPNHPPYETDYWIIKVSSDGTKEWDRTIGTQYDDELTALIQTRDGGYLLGGYGPEGSSGDKTDPASGYWIVKLSPAGTTEWDRTYHTTDHSSTVTCMTAVAGGYLVGGSTYSDSTEDKTENAKGDQDIWVIKINEDGTRLWDKTIGSSGQDGLAALLETRDGGLILAGTSAGPADGDKTEEPKGRFDYWIVKLDKAQQIEWDRTFGGGAPGYSSPSSMALAADGGYVIAGSTTGLANGDLSRNAAEEDYWIVKLNTSGFKVWDKPAGGSAADSFVKICNSPDGGYLVGGQSLSGISGDKTVPVKGGERDFWLIKLAPESPLPITLSAFFVQKENTTALLTWQTTSEAHADRFEIEHSTNGTYWNHLGTLRAQGGLNALHTYQFIHPAPAVGENLYRLKSLDHDGSYMYSRIEHAWFDHIPTVSVYPNPAVETIHVQVADWTQVGKIQVFDRHGKVVYQSARQPDRHIHASFWGTGLYVVRISLTDGSEAVCKVWVAQ